MIDHTTYQLAMRSHALTLLAATTGAISMSTTTTGFVRAAGSFKTDGFNVGMELTAAGFTPTGNNGVATITGVTDLTITVSKSLTASVAAGSRSLSVGLPSVRAWENVTTTPTPNTPYVEEQYIPGPTRTISVNPNAILQLDPMYAVLVYAPSNSGISAAGNYADALLTLFAPNTAIALSSGDVLRVRGDVGPFRGQLRQAQPGWALVPVTIPFRLFTANSI